jgi:hypothetical protein
MWQKDRCIPPPFVAEMSLMLRLFSAVIGRCSSPKIARIQLLDEVAAQCGNEWRQSCLSPP